MQQNSFYPGKVWKDTEGKRIQAHGGSVLFVNDTFYWYGENKEKSFTSSDIWQWGVKCYSSKDLYNWEDIGIILPPETEDETNPLHYTQHAERPHILYNEKTKKFVLWIKIIDKNNPVNQYMAIYTADAITGPYQNVNVWKPNDMSSGDFDLVKNDKTGEAYIYFDAIFGDKHSYIACVQLDENYTGIVGEYSLHMGHPERMLGREAPAFFERNGMKYLIVSQTTGFFPNPSECFVSKDYHGEWKNLGYVHKNDVERTSFRSQVSAVFKHPKKKDLYIAMADRWLVNLPENIPHNWFEIDESFVNPDKEPLISTEEYMKYRSYNKPDIRDISIADYVWLPVKFNGDMPYIEWYDEWKIETFE